MKVNNVRFAYSVKVGPVEVTYASTDNFTMTFQDGYLKIKDLLGNSSIVFPSNIAYMVPDEKETNSIKEKPKKAVSRSSSSQD